jgi:hypothetical protein
LGSAVSVEFKLTEADMPSIEVRGKSKLITEIKELIM